MNEATCSIIGDILPLYIDGVVSEDTKKLVEAHLEHCMQCRKKYESMKQEATIPVEADIAPLKHFKSAWKKKKRILMGSTALITGAVICCILFLFSHLPGRKRLRSTALCIRKKGIPFPRFPPAAVNWDICAASPTGLLPTRA